MSMRIIEAPAHRRLEAVGLLLPRHATQAARARLEKLLESGRLDPTDLIVAASDTGDLVASAMAVTAPGRSATVYATPPHDKPTAATTTALLACVIETLKTAPIDLAQALLDTQDTWSHRAHLDAGFIDLAELHTMELTIGRRLTEPTWPSRASIEPAIDRDLLAVLADTYQDTMDCPLLRGRRRIEDILEGHRASGTIDPSTWLMLRLDDVPAGCILVTGAGTTTADLAYVGLIPSARGAGHGIALIRTVLVRLRALGTSRIRLAVDGANEPALRVYRHLGFRNHSARRAVIRSLRDVQVGSPESEMSTPR